MWCVGGVGTNYSWKKGCSWEMQCQFVQTLVMSRLLFTAHVWTLRHKDTALLHRPYMRALRRIAGAGWKSNETTPPITDSEVRRRLGAPSIECLLIKARLQYLGRVCRERHKFPTLWGQEVRKCTKGTEADMPDHPWVQQLRADMRALWALSPMARLFLPSPEQPGCENSWLNAAEDEKKWRALVGGLHFKESTFDKKGDESRVKSHPVVNPWTCSECGEHFTSEMARDQHIRKKHGRRCTLSWKVGDTSTCPNCMTDFRQRFTLVHLAHEKRGKERGCRDFWLAQPDVDSDLADSLWEQDHTLLRAA